MYHCWFCIAVDPYCLFGVKLMIPSEIVCLYLDHDQVGSMDETELNMTPDPKYVAFFCHCNRAALRLGRERCSIEYLKPIYLLRILPCIPRLFLDKKTSPPWDKV